MISVGMDAYCLLRFNYLCLRICLFATFWGMLVLTPIYALSGSEEEGEIYYITLANVSSDSNVMVGGDGGRGGGGSGLGHPCGQHVPKQPR